ncbi:RTA1 like protein-domain-containing protein [Dactylonectria estremocensis]|uniref:RTA1 like protein-domain-containing protein n=1 Tax=Dactylonectria estremocensis TaxID=1079267 RepID=A0A9P9J2Q5_9HYPO|nr:RTA1 like protein-domain-containing protein [Dactylonectria estremocensis]
MSDNDCDPNYKHADFSKYRFEPSLGVNILFVILFTLTTGLHLVQLWRTRTWYLSALVIGGCCEMIGYIGRAIGAKEDAGCWTLGPFVIQSLLILIAPALMAASIYMILGRIILLTQGEKFALIRQRWLTKVFVTGDVISLWVQSSGGGLMASEDNFEAGEKVIIAGLFVQLLIFGVFIVVAAIYHKRLRETPTTRSLDPEVRWQAYLTTLYVAGALIWVRSLFRVIEFIQGNDGPLMRSEAYVFVFDGLLMFVVLAWMNWFHPSEIGLLLRGDQPITNGLELLKVRRRAGKNTSGARERLSSSQSTMIDARQ